MTLFVGISYIMYDGLIGSDLLTQLHANIDMKNKKLFTKGTCIPIIYSPPIREIYVLPPRSELRVKLPVNLLHGEGILNFTEFTKGVRMPTALVNCIHGYATTVIQNSRSEQMELTVTSSFKVEQYSGTNLEFDWKNIILTETCKEEVRKYNLKGRFLVIPYGSCETQIGDKIISKVAETRTPEVKLLLNPVTMPELQQEIRIEDSQVDLRGVTLTISKIFSIVQNTIVKVIRRNHLEPKYSSPADFSLKGGGVKRAHPIDLCFVSQSRA
ncbi:unnamed protein product [Leptidea sinapis]|uniref:Uncharacterized protein n=1 Tax=Leptidea sinapis TaxID=189913 RepID=A0A5E4PLX3_9NEOP|nr:unnamed protein product [Leptidea sinapis]